MKTFILCLMLQMTSLQVNAQCWKFYTAYGHHSLIMTMNGKLYATGWNWAGQLGDGTFIDRNSWTLVDSSNTWTSISAGAGMNLGLKKDGTIWTWGFNGQYQLGDGTNISRSGPVQVGKSKDWQTVFAGCLSNFAMKRDGTLWAWGDNSGGELGNYDTRQQAYPIEIEYNDWKIISPGMDHVVALKKDGTLWTWGGNMCGQLGDGLDGSNVIRSYPLQIDPANDWVAVAAGNHQSYALKKDGTLWACGYNGAGHLGDGTRISRNRLTKVEGGGYKSVSAGQDHVLSIREDGTLWAWGYNKCGQLGDGTRIDQYHPIQVGTSSDWQSVKGGQQHSMAMKKDGSLWIWGWNHMGQLGNGTNTDVLVPTMVVCDSADIPVKPVTGPGAFNVYPNPGAGIVQIQHPAGQWIDRILIYDAIGKMVYEKAGHQTEVNIEVLAAAVYTMQVISGGNIYQFRLIRQ